MVNVGILGCGTVGGGLVELIGKNRRHIRERTGIDLQIRKILVRDKFKSRPSCATGGNGFESVITHRSEDVVDDPAIDVVVELIGGVEPARAMVARAIRNGKHVVTANKALLSACGGDLFSRAERRGILLGFEGSVCGGIPIIRILEEGLAGDRIDSLLGILNGTTNYVLGRMATEGLSLPSALEEARAKGICERDAALDVDGIDAAQKLSILIRLAFGRSVSPERIETTGIGGISPADLRDGRKFGYEVKLVAFAARREKGIECRVCPAFVRRGHPLAEVHGEENALMIEGKACGRLFFSGKGAGSLPTASAVLSDVIGVARGMGVDRTRSSAFNRCAPSGPVSDFASPVFLRVPVLDRPGIIGRIATILGRSSVSIRHAEAELDDRRPGMGWAKILTHDCSDKAVRKALREIAALPLVRGTPTLLRIVQ